MVYKTTPTFPICLVGVSDNVIAPNNFMTSLVAGFKSRLNPYLLPRVYYRLYPFNDTYTHYNTKTKVKEDK